VKELVEYIVRSLVSSPDRIVIRELAKSADSLTYEVQVPDEDFGRVIGRAGTVANAIRAVVKAAASKQTDKKVYVDFVNEP
jgi:predicted RNA-binding protein YlqC (UPF0109 family)